MLRATSSMDSATGAEVHQLAAMPVVAQGRWYVLECILPDGAVSHRFIKMVGK